MAKRAMTEAAKNVKSQAILDTVAEMFLITEYEKIKMADIAKVMGISNGLLFVYFKTKETLFMCLLWREYEKRLDYLINIAQTAKIENYSHIKQLFMAELEWLVDTNPLYIRLESMRSAIFEKNADLEVMFNMKKTLFERMREFTSIISKNGILTQNQFIDIFLMEASIITGCKLNSVLPPAVDDIIRQLGVDGFKRDFKVDVMTMVSCFLDGYLNIA